MPMNNPLIQESVFDRSEEYDYSKEFEAVQAVVTAEIAENVKQANADPLTEADLEAIKF
jgi:hypothetical protein